MTTPQKSSNSNSFILEIYQCKPKGSCHHEIFASINHILKAPQRHAVQGSDTTKT
jgi:hypothetical protein